MKDIEKPTKITIKNHGKKFTATLPWDANVEDCIDAFIGLMVTSGYNIKSIENNIIEKGQEYGN